MAALPSSFAAASAMADPGRILDSLSTSVLIVDRARAILYLNVAAESLFGTSRNQARGRPLEELFADVHDRGGLIVTFLALLEMIRLKLIRVFQSASFGPIRVYKRPRPADAPHPIGDPEAQHG